MHHIAAFLRSHGIHLNTHLGQHFLTDTSVLRVMLEAAHIRPGEHVVEVGPGIGVLTAELLKAGAHVTAIELDDRLIPLLEEYVQSQHKAQRPKPHVIHANALQTPMPERPWKMVANIPYHITSPLLRHIYLESPVRPDSATLLIQREVAEKICNTEAAGILTILVALFGTPRIVAHVPPEAFLPPPAVDSSILHIATHPTPLADTATIREVHRLLNIAFAGKRKMLRNTLGAFPGGMERLEAACVAPTRRPQTLSVEEWIALAWRKPAA